MFLTEITSSDLHKLNHARIDRLLGFFTASLPCCQIQLAPYNVLMIHCPNAVIADDLLADLADLRYHVWLVLGVKSIVIYLADEAIIHTDTYE